MGENAEKIAKEINKEEKKLQKVDEKISLWTQEEVKTEIKEYVRDLKWILESIKDMGEEIETVEDAAAKEILKEQLQELQKDIADLRDDGDVNQSIMTKTQNEILKANEELEAFLKDYIRTTKSKLDLTVGMEYKEKEDGDISIHRYEMKLDSKDITFKNGLKIADTNIREATIYDDPRVTFKITDPETIQAIKDNTLEILQHPNIQINIYTDWHYEITIKDTDISTLWEEWYVENFEEKLIENGEKLSEEINTATWKINTAAWKIEKIMKSSDDTEKKYNSLIEAGNDLSSENKIKYLAVFAKYLRSIYDFGLYDEKKNVFKDVFASKNTSDEEMLSTEEDAGVCGDHHRLVAELAEDLWFSAGVVSATAWALHNVTRIKDWEKFLLIDYGSVYKAETPEKLMADYYASNRSTPKPFDIVTDADGNIIGEITTALGNMVGDNLSPYWEANSANVALNTAENGITPIEQGSTYEVKATNLNQEIKRKKWSKNERYQLLWKITNNENIDNASITSMSLTKENQKELNSSFATTLTMNNIRRETGKQANNIWLWFGYKKELTPITIGDEVSLKSAFVAQWWLWFETNEELSWEWWPINIETPSFIANTGIATTTNEIPINQDISVQAYGSVEWKLLSNRTDDPFKTITIKPKTEIGATAKIAISENTNIATTGNVSTITYNKWATTTGYGAWIAVNGKNINVQANIEGEKSSLSDESILAKRFMREVGAVRTPEMNVFGNKASIFGNISGTSINDGKNKIQGNVGINLHI